MSRGIGVLLACIALVGLSGCGTADVAGGPANQQVAAGATTAAAGVFGRPVAIPDAQLTVAAPVIDPDDPDAIGHRTPGTTCRSP